MKARKFAFLDNGLRTALAYGRKHCNHNSNREIWFIVFKANLAITNGVPLLPKLRFT